MSDQSAQRFGVWSGRGGYLDKDLTLFRFGKRVEAVHLANLSSASHLIDIQVARDPVFYWPLDAVGKNVERTAIFQETYFYVALGAGQTYDSPPFFARRGLKIKKVKTGAGNVFAEAIVHGVSDGEIQFKRGQEVP